MATTGRLISELVDGVRDTNGAVIASGKARFYNTGTLVAATVYSDSATATPYAQPITLNAGGQKVTPFVWARGAVRMIVKDSTDSTTLLDIDPVSTLRAEQVYVTNANVNGGAETDLDTILGGGLAVLYTEAGSSTTRTVQTVLGERFISVKDYGAVGDGSTDDTTAIQNTMTRLSNLGGGCCLFPTGTYKTTAAITVPANVHVWGRPGGPGSSGGVIIKQFTTAVLGWLTVAAANADVMIEGIKFTANNAAHTGRMISASGGSGGRVVVRNCAFGAWAGDNIVPSATTTHLMVADCDFESATETQDYLDGSATPSWVATFVNCRFVGTGASANFECGSSTRVSLVGCRIYSDTGLAADELFGGTGKVMVSGGSIEFDAAGTTVLRGDGVLSLTGAAIIEGTGAGQVYLVASGASVFEAGCQFSGTVNMSSVTWGGSSQAREVGIISTSAVTTSHTPDAGNYGTVMYTQTGGATFVWNNPTVNAPLGSRLRLIYYNTSGGNITNTFGNAFGVAAATITNNNNASAWSFIRQDIGANVKWVCVGPQTVFTP